MHFIGSALLESLSLWESLLPSYYASPSPDGLRRIDLRPAGAEGVGGGFGFGFGAEHAEDRRAAAGHNAAIRAVFQHGFPDFRDLIQMYRTFKQIAAKRCNFSRLAGGLGKFTPL